MNIFCGGINSVSFRADKTFFFVAFNYFGRDSVKVTRFHAISQHLESVISHSHECVYEIKWFDLSLVGIRRKALKHAYGRMSFYSSSVYNQKYWVFIYLYSTFFFSISSHLSWLDSSDYDYQTNIDELEWEECSYSPRAHTVDLERVLQWMQQLEKTQIRLSVFILGRFELLRAQWNRFRRSSLHFEPFFCMKSYILRLCWKVSRP